MHNLKSYPKTICFLLFIFAMISTQIFAKAYDIPFKIMVNAGPDKTICQGDTTTLNATGAVSYSWTPSLGLDDPNIAAPKAFPNTTTTYVVFGTDGAGNITNDTVKVTVNIPAPVNTGADTTFCEGQASVQLNAIIAGVITSYSWYPATGLSATNIQNPVATPDTTTLYSVIVTDQNGCKSFGDRLVTVFPNHVTSIADTSLCTNDTVSIHAEGGVSYLWQPGTALLNPADSTQATALFATINDTILYLTVIDSFGCTIRDTIQITSKAIPFVNAGLDTVMLCRDSVYLVATASPGVTYTWSPWQHVDNMYSPITWGRPWYTGDFIIEVQDPITGCKNWDSRYVTLADHFLNVVVNNDTVLCEGASLPLLATVTHPVVIYEWSSAGGSFNDSYIKDPIFTPFMNTTAYVYVRDSLECKDMAEVNVTFDPFQVQTIPDSNICFGSTIILSTNGGSIFAWSPGIGIDNQTSPAPIANPSATTTYFLEAIDALGCYTYDTVTLTVKPRPVANAGNDREICAGDSVQLQAYGGDYYQWSPTTGLNNAYISNPKASPSIVTSYVVTAFNQWGCKDDDLMRVEVRPVPVISYGTDASICQEDTVLLFASGADEYAWSPITGLSNASEDTLTAYPMQTTVYRVIGSTEYGCTDTGFVTINVTPTPHATIVGYPGICEGNNVTLSVNDGSTFLWNTGETTSSITVSPATSSWFSVATFNGVCGGLVDSFFVEVWKNPIADFIYTQNTQFAPIPIAFTDNSQFATTYTWDFGMEEFLVHEENPIHNFPFAGDYIVTLIAESHLGCTDTISKTISLINTNLSVPSAFTPNEVLDNVNSRFKIGHYGISEFHITIEARNGKMVFESEDPDFQWDGNVKGQPAPEGVYLYKIDAKAESHKKFQKYGTITLIR